MHEQRRIQDLHSLICKGIGLHCDRDLNGSHELFGLVLIPIKWIGISSLGTSDQVVRGLDGYAGLGVHAIACATVDAVAEATLVMSLRVSATQVWRKASEIP